MGRSELLHMDFHHHDHDADEEFEEIQKTTVQSAFSILVKPLQSGFQVIKLMWPLTLLSVPLIWVFPWELLTSGFKSQRKFFNDVPGSVQEDQTALKFREKVLKVSTLFNFILSVVIGGSGGGGGGGHH